MGDQAKGAAVVASLETIAAVKAVVLLLMLAVGLLLFIDIVWFLKGSLEEFPTEEQIDKVRTVSAIIGVFFVLIEIGLWSLLGRMRRRERE